METYDAAEHLNVGTGEDLTIAELAQKVAQVVGYTGQIRFDPARPDGTPRKLLDVSRIHSLGWRAMIPLEEGIRSTYDWLCTHAAAAV
jgi:GDP-L-fucose synthase